MNMIWSYVNAQGKFPFSYFKIYKKFRDVKILEILKNLRTSQKIKNLKSQKITNIRAAGLNPFL